jgi:hypothetical protein
VLHAARVGELLEQEPRLQIPEEVALTQPSAGDPRWQLDVGVEGPFTELADPWAIRLSAGLRNLALEHVDLRGYEVLGRIRHHLHLL